MDIEHLKKEFTLKIKNALYKIGAPSDNDRTKLLIVGYNISRIGSAFYYCKQREVYLLLNNIPFTIIGNYAHEDSTLFCYNCPKYILLETLTEKQIKDILFR